MGVAQTITQLRGRDTRPSNMRKPPGESNQHLLNTRMNNIKPEKKSIMTTSRICSQNNRTPSQMQHEERKKDTSERKRQTNTKVKVTTPTHN